MIEVLGILVLVASLMLAGCGGGSSSGPAGPDEVPSAEREAHLNEMKGRLNEPTHLTRMSIADVAALPRFPHRYGQSQLAEIAALEQRGVTVEGFVARVRPRDDGDYHIQLTEVWPGRCLGNDTPDQLFTELTPGVRDRKRAYTLERLRALCATDVRVRVSGWLMWDTPHHTRITFWEVHPVTRIEVCCWRELS